MSLIPVADSAGVLVRKVDKSQVPASLAPAILWGAIAIKSERGFINQVYEVQDTYERELIFGKKDWRAYGVSAHDLDNYLSSKNPSYVVRGGFTDYTNTTDCFRIAGWTVTYDAGVSDSALWTAAGRAQASLAGGAIKSIEDYTVTANEKLHFIAKGEGSWGNDITLRFTIPTTDVFQTGDSTRITYVEIAYEDNVKEEFYISTRRTDTDATGKSIYILDQFANSNYVSVLMKSDFYTEFLMAVLEDVYSGATTYALGALVSYQNKNWISLQNANVGKNPAAEPTWWSEYWFPLTGGVGDYTAAAVADSTASQAFMATALNKILQYSDTYDSFIAMNGGYELSDAAFYTAVVTNNGRCLGISSISKTNAVSTPSTSSALVTLRGSTYTNDDFRILGPIANWVLQVENESGQSIWITPIGILGSIIAQDNNNGQLPYAPAGFRRGTIQNISGVSPVWTPNERYTLAGDGGAQYNVIRSDKFGTEFWSENSSQRLKTAFSDAHVSISYLAQVRAIESTCRGYEFEFNDQETVDSLVSNLQDLADAYVREKYAEQILVDSKMNVIGSDQIRIRWNIRFKGVAKTIVIDVIAYPSTKDLSVSMAEVA